VPASGTLLSKFLTDSGTYSDTQWLESMAAAPFPGTGSVKTLSDELQLPNYYFYTDTSTKPTGLTLNNIAEQSETGAISFTATLITPTGISEVKKQREADGTIYDLLGRKVQQADKGVYIIDGKKVVVK
jgi:hypothetical protein